MDVSIIIVNYNTKELLKDCIKSIYDQTHDLNFEIIVVDNASTDGSQEYLKTNFPYVLFIESEINLGFGKANNHGVQYANGDFLFFLNSDTILLNNAIYYFLDFYKKNQNLDIGCLGGVLLDKHRNANHSSESFPLKRKIIFNYLNNYFGNFIRSPFKKEIREFLDSDYFEVDYITGAALFLPRKLFKKIGGFDPVFFMYYEETDLQLQVFKKRLKQYIIKGPQIIHLEGASVSESFFSSKKRIMVDDGMLKYFRKNSRLVPFYIFKIIYICIRIPVLFDRRISLKERVKYLFSLLK